MRKFLRNRENRHQQIKSPGRTANVPNARLIIAARRSFGALRVKRTSARMMAVLANTSTAAGRSASRSVHRIKAQASVKARKSQVGEKNAHIIPGENAAPKASSQPMRFSEKSTRVKSISRH